MSRKVAKQNMKNTAEVVIIGAGVIGCSTAYHLAKMGITDVAILEMEQVGADVG